MRDLNSYTDDDLEALAVESLQTYLNRRGSRRGDEAVEVAADAMWALRTRARLSSGETDINGLSTAYRAQASRIYQAVVAGALGRDGRVVHDRISAAIQRRMRSRRDAWATQQTPQEQS